MGYRELPPAPALRHLVACYWTMERDYRQVAEPRETVWPDGKTELLFHRGDRYRVGEPEGSALAAGFVLGPLTRRLVLASPGRVDLVGVRLRPWGLAALVGLPVDELTDTLLPVEDLWGVDGRRLVERLGESDAGEAVRVLETFLLARARQLGPALRSMAALASDIVRTGGRLRLQREADVRDLSLRQVERWFRRVTGLSPKRLAVVSRFDAARRHLLAHPDDTVSDVACRFGYFDYAHLSKDFARFLGTTPYALQAAARAMRAESRPDVVFLHEAEEAGPAAFAP
jgi:AraC-like DNA-binding protein